MKNHDETATGPRTRLAIFNTFKTKSGKLTGEAQRQRAIIAILANNANPTDRTRTGISQRIAKKQNIIWKNLYSGVFRDLDEILLPMGIAGEDGRLPLKRGPKALQEKGIPFYHLTRRGILVALSIAEVRNRDALLERFLAESEGVESEYAGILRRLAPASPAFTYNILQRYVMAFCDGVIDDLLPMDLSRLADMHDKSLAIQREIVRAFRDLPGQQQDETVMLLDQISQDAAKH